MKCQAFVKVRPYSHPGQCESIAHVQQIKFKGKVVRGLCSHHRRPSVINRIQLITDPSLDLEALQGTHGFQTEISGVSPMPIRKHGTNGRIRGMLRLQGAFSSLRK